MARKTRKGQGRTGKARGARPAPLRWLRRWLLRSVVAVAVLLALALAALRFVNPPTTHTIWAERHRLGSVSHEWVPLSEIAPVMARAVVAAEDANFCTHWGFDMGAIRAAIEDGAQRGGSTISQQVVKNVFLWQGRSWLRKGLEAGLTPLVEAAWPKRRILEIYLNVAEMGEGVFGVEAAAQHHFGIPASALSAGEAALLAAILPAPRDRDPARPSGFVQRRASGIADGAATIARDGRAACFETPSPA